MAFVLEDSPSAMQAENDLFAVPASFTDRFKTEHEKVNPATVLSEEGNSSDATFHLPACTHALLSLNDIYMEMEVAIKCREGAGEWRMITAADGVAPVNNSAHSLFQNLTIEMAGRTVTDSSNYYAYRAYLQTLLTHSQSALVSQMKSSMFYLDTAAMTVPIMQAKLLDDRIFFTNSTCRYLDVLPPTYSTKASH